MNENETVYAVVGGEGRPGKNSSDVFTAELGFPDGGGTKTGTGGDSGNISYYLFIKYDLFKAYFII